MTPTLESRGTFAVLGVPTRIRRGSEAPELFCRVWATFESRRPEIEPAATEEVFVGASFPADEPEVTDYLAGMVVAAGAPVPDGLAARTIPGGRYAVFECPVDAIGATYHHVFAVWLPNATVQFDATRAAFEEYPENTPESPVRLFIPIR